MKDKSRLGYWTGLILPGLMLRLWIAPFTTGSDIAQFAGFADTFLRHHLHFFDYSDGEFASVESWPYPWPYVYGPLFIILLGLLRIIAPSPVVHFWKGNEYIVYVPRDWILANKLVYIAFDIISTVLLVLITSRISRHGKLPWLIGALYFYNPMIIYISSIYGMFDQISLAFLLLGIYFYLNNRSLKTITASWALGALFKPSILIAIIPFPFYLARKYGVLTALRWLTLLAGLILVGYSPFFLSSPHSLYTYVNAVREVGCPCYTEPVAYSFNGFSSVAFYAWNHLGINTTYILSKWVIPFTIFYIILFYYSYKSDSPLESFGIGYSIYIATYWRVNAQYLVMSVALLLLLSTIYRNRKPILTYALITAWFLIGLWPLMYPIAFWAHVHIKDPNPTILEFLSMISLNIYDDLIYVYYSLSLTITFIFIIINYFSSTRNPIRITPA